MKSLLIAILTIVAASVTHLSMREIEDRAAAGDMAAIAMLRDSAESGNAGAMNFLGFLYWQGQGTPLLRDSAIYFLNKASEAGDYKAKANLGHLLLTGAEEIPADTLKAIRMLDESARHGARAAMRELADYFARNEGDSLTAFGLKTVADGYSHGHLLPYNYHRAVEYYHRASLLGDTLSTRIINELLEIFPDILNK